MKKSFLFIVFFLLLSVSVFSLPLNQVHLTANILDYANVLSTSSINEIQPILYSLQQQEIAQVAIVTVDNFDGLTKEEYALEIAHENLGDSTRDNGLLILIGIEPKEYRIEVGYGLEGDLNDALIGRIARETLVPQFQQGNYGEGVLLFTQAINNILNPDGNYSSQQTYPPRSSNGIIIWFGFIILFSVFRNISYNYFSKKQNKNISPHASSQAFSAALLASFFLRPPRGGLGGGLNGFSGGGFSGGFGGGGFGGGGGGGGW